MVVRFVLSCMIITFIFMLAIPVLLGTTSFREESSIPAIASAEQPAAQTAESQDAFAVFTDIEPIISPESLNEMMPAAGEGVLENDQESFGNLFFQKNQSAFTDQEIPVNSSKTDIEL